MSGEELRFWLKEEADRKKRRKICFKKQENIRLVFTLSPSTIQNECRDLDESLLLFRAEINNPLPPPPKNKKKT